MRSEWIWSLGTLKLYCSTQVISQNINFRWIFNNNSTIKKILGNLPQSTKLLLQQSAHAEKMSNKMCEDDEKLYIDYFNHFQDYLKKNFSSAATVNLKKVKLITSMIKLTEMLLFLRNLWLMQASTPFSNLQY